jgi:hypothetical protein
MSVEMPPVAFSRCLARPKELLMFIASSRTRVTAALLAVLTLAPVLSVAQEVVAITSCNQYMVPQRMVAGRMVGQTNCLMQDVGVADPEKKYHRVEVGLDGTLDGWIVKEGRARLNHFTSQPDFLYVQFGNPSPRFRGVLTYEAAKGTSMTLLYPESGWNGKLWVMVHGSGGSFRRGTMRAWDKYYNPARPFGDVTKYEKAMLDKGYAVARTRRNADRFVAGDFNAVLDTGEKWTDLNVNLAPELILDGVRLAGNMLQARLGRRPTRNYWYGHSAGAYMALALNYLQTLGTSPNYEPEGGNLISGFLADDPGGGLFVPVLMRNGQDVLLRTAAEKARFIKTIVVAHQAYPLAYTAEIPGEMDLRQIPKWVSASALTNKRSTARMMREKGVDGGYRMYEVRGVSHSGGESLPDGRNGDVEILDLSRFIDGAVDLLDNWVEKGASPPITRSAEAGVGNSPDAVSLPEVACPLGQYFAYPPMLGEDGVGSTGFAAYDGESLEPLNGLIQLVDMNGDGKRGRRETVTEAWRRMGLLKAGETFSRERYVACVKVTASKLQGERFITGNVAKAYVDAAQSKPLPAK